MRILWHAINGSGLGHVTRVLAIAQAVRAARPGWDHLFLTNSDAHHLIGRQGFPAFKLPSRVSLEASVTRTSLHTRLVQAATLSVATAYDPQILVADTLPAGTYQELLPLLQWPIFRAFIFREQKPEAASAEGFQQLLRAFHLVLIPHPKPIMARYAPRGVNVRWTGEILSADRHSALTRNAARAQLGLPVDRDVCLVTAGGGSRAATTMVRSALMAVRRRRPKTLVAYAPGAFGPRDGLGPCTIIEAFPLARYLRAFDIAIATAGYNTFNELMHFGIPTAFVPLPRQIDDQHLRAEAAELVGAAVLVRGMTQRDMREGMRSLFGSGVHNLRRVARQLVPHNGATVAARVLIRTVEGTARSRSRRVRDTSR